MRVGRLATVGALGALPLMVACQNQPATTPPPAVPPPGTVPASSAPASSTPASSAPASSAPASSAPAPSGPGSPSASAAPTSSSKQGQLIDYRKNAGEDGVAIKSEADVAKLTGAPEPFKTFIRSEFTKLKKETPADCPEVSIGVGMLRTDGYAIGSVNGCGGAMLAWAAPQGTWSQIWGGQDMAQCAPFKRVKFPVEVFEGLGDTCFDNGNVVPYQP